MGVFIVSALVHEKRQIEDIPPCKRERNKGERERERDESLYGKSSALLFLTCIMVTPLVKMKASQSHKKIYIYINKKSKIQHNSTQLNTDLPKSPPRVLGNH